VSPLQVFLITVGAFVLITCIGALVLLVLDARP